MLSVSRNRNSGVYRGRGRAEFKRVSARPVPIVYTAPPAIPAVPDPVPTPGTGTVVRISLTAGGKKINCVIPKEPAVREAIHNNGMRINGFRNSGGREPGMGHFLVLKADMEAINLPEFAIKATITDGRHTVELFNLVLVGSRRFMPTDNDNDLLLITVSDVRYIFLQQKLRREFDPFPPHEKYSAEDFVVAKEPFSGSIENGIQKYWNHAYSFDATPPTLNFGFANLPTINFKDVFTKYTGSAYEQMSDILDLVSHSFYRYPNGNYFIIDNGFVNSSNSSLVVQNRNRLIAKRYNDAHPAGYLPRTVKVRYRKLDCDFYIDTLDYSFDYAGSINTVVNVIRDCHVFNVFDEEHENQAAYKTDLETLATELSDLYFGSYENNRRYNAIYFGVIPFQPGPDCHTIEYYHDVVDGKYKTLVKSIDLAEHAFPDICTDLIQEYRRIDCGSEAASSITYSAPEGGIPPRVGPVLGKATVSIIKRAGLGSDVIISTGETVTVYNTQVVAVNTTGERIGRADIDEFGDYWAEVGDCNDPLPP